MGNLIIYAHLIQRTCDSAWLLIVITLKILSLYVTLAPLQHVGLIYNTALISLVTTAPPLT